MTSGVDQQPTPWSPADARFFRGQLFPRVRTVFVRKRVLACLIGAVLTASFAHRLPLGQLKVSELSSAALAFAGLAFGACVTGSVLSLSLPQEQARNWARNKPTGGTHSHYSELIFNFVWSGLAQVAVAVACIAGFIFGGNQVVAPANGWFSNYVCIFVSSLTFYYALIQLVTILITIIQVGHVLIAQYNRPD